eukprot:scaffold23061_cov116-Isochrysis_galbana.AAC.4
MSPVWRLHPHPFKRLLTGCLDAIVGPRQAFRRGDIRGDGGGGGDGQQLPSHMLICKGSRVGS